MKKGQGFSDRNPLIHCLFQFTGAGDHVQPHEGVQKDAHTVGQPAREKTHNEDNCGLQRFPLQCLALDALRQLGDDDAVADEDDQTRQYETHQDLLEAENNCPYESAVLWIDALADDPGVTGAHAFIEVPGDV